MVDPPDPRKVGQLLQNFEILGLASLAPDLARHLGHIGPETNAEIIEAIWPYIVEKYQEVVGDYETTGFINVPPSFYPSGFPVALDKTGAVVHISDQGNTLFVGSPGSGKTNLKFASVLAAKRAEKTIRLGDGKFDDWWITTIFRFTHLDNNYDKNLLECPPWRSIEQHINEQVDRFCECFYAGEQQGAILRKAMRMAFAKRPDPSWKDVHENVDWLAKQKGLYQYQQACVWVSEKISKISMRYGFAYASNEPGYIAALATDLYIPLESSDQAGEWLLVVTLNHDFEQAKDAGGPVQKVAFIDESIGLVHKYEYGRIGANPLTKLWVRTRQFGPLIHMTLVSLAQADPTIATTAATIVILPGVHESSLRIAGLSPKQGATCRRLVVGQACFIYPGRLSGWGVLASFAQVPDRLKGRRPIRVAEPIAPVPVVPVALPQETQAVPAVVQEGEGQPSADRALLEALYASGGIETTTAAYRLARLPYEVGDGANQRLQKTGLISSSKIVASSGRGGTAKALQISNEGYAWLGKEPPRRTRGGGAASEYYCQRLIELLPDAHLEISLENKAADITFRYDEQKHAAFAAALAEHAITIGEERPLAGLIALEIESTTDSANIAKSLRNNCTKDAHLDVVVFCVMPKVLRRAEEILSREEKRPKGLILIDVLQLLVSLRKGR